VPVGTLSRVLPPGRKARPCAGPSGTVGTVLYSVLRRVLFVAVLVLAAVLASTAITAPGQFSHFGTLFP
jgi:hypothetical protein